MDIYNAANGVAREFIAGTYRNVREFEVTIARNAILDCLHSSEEPDFINKIAHHPLHGSDGRRVIKKMEPHLVELCGRTIGRANGTAA